MSSFQKQQNHIKARMRAHTTGKYDSKKQNKQTPSLKEGDTGLLDRVFRTVLNRLKQLKENTKI